MDTIVSSASSIFDAVIDFVTSLFDTATGSAGDVVSSISE